MAPTKQLSSPPDVLVLTGTIGSGKTTVAGMLAELGAAVVNADELAREVVRPGSPALAEIVTEFGPTVLKSSGELDRKKLGEIVFRDPVRLGRLETITHPRIRELAATRFEAARAKESPLLIYDCPLFFEARLDRGQYCGVIVVDANEKVCLERVMKRDGLTEEQAKLRLSQQMPTTEKVTRADHVIENSGSLAELKQKVETLFEKLRCEKAG